MSSIPPEGSMARLVGVSLSYQIDIIISYMEEVCQRKPHPSPVLPVVSA